MRVHYIQALARGAHITLLRTSFFFQRDIYRLSNFPILVHEIELRNIKTVTNIVIQNRVY
jgi:hypothetical protein